jgi:hypothetical protein
MPEENTQSNSTTSNPENLGFAGDVRVNQITLISANGGVQDITLQVMQIEIFEDIFAPFLTGSLIVKDSQEIAHLLPLIGEEYISIHIHTPSMEEMLDFKLQCLIYKLDNKVKTAEREIAYKLYFISKEAVVDINTKVSRGFKGLIHQIVEEIFKEILFVEKDYIIEEAQNNIRFISNYWKPTKCLEWCADHAVNLQGSPSFLFWETGDGFQFRTLLSLYQNAPLYQRFVWDNYSGEIFETGGSTMDIGKNYQRIQELYYPTTFDYFKRLRSGLYGSQIIYYDLFAHQYVHTAYVPTWNEKEGLNPNPVWTSNVTFNTKALILHEHQYRSVFNGYDDVSNTKFKQQRLSLLAQAEDYKINITVLGRCDYHAGQKVYVEIPQNKQIKKETQEKNDLLASGNYIIGAICHTITHVKHTCTMELIKDSYIKGLG